MTYAAFLLASPASRPHGGLLCATTRALDRGEAGRIGLPGGKLDPGETPEQACRREAAEEGWLLPAGAVLTAVHRADVDGRPVVWLRSDRPATRRVEYPERGRITPIVATRQDVAASGYGNDWLCPDPWGTYCAEGQP